MVVSREEKERIARVKLQQIYENSNAKERVALGKTLGFRGSNRSIRNSVQRLATRGRTRGNIRPGLFGTINRSYGALAGKGGRLENKELGNIGTGDKIKITNNFKPYVLPFQDIWNRTSPSLLLDSNFRISAFVACVIEEEPIFEIKEFAIYTDETSKDFVKLVESLQDRVDDLFKPIRDRKYQGLTQTSFGMIRAVAFSREGALEMKDYFEELTQFNLEVPTQINGDFGVTLTSVRQLRNPENPKKLLPRLYV
tara:strand:- start:107 stop:868 length:762 start_codon:yes stop_codon:yes gene_type:complete